VAADLDIVLGADQSWGHVVTHVMAWCSRRFCFWVDKSDIHQSSCLSAHTPIMVSAISGHSIPVDMMHLCKNLIRTRSDQVPDTIVHATFFTAVEGILAAGGLAPGGGREHPRPIHCETYAVVQGRKGDGHRETAEVSIFVNPKKFADDCENDKNLGGFVENGVLLIQEAVPIMIWKRVECIGGNARLTLWANPEEDELGWFKCKQCKWLIPSGTRICWNYQCLAPCTKSGFDDLVRMYSEQGDLKQIRNLSIRCDVKVSKSHVRRETAEHEVRRNEVTHDIRKRVPIPSRELTNVAKPAKFSSIDKKMKYAKSAMRATHPDFPERNFYSHKERYDRDLNYGDGEYARLSRENGHCDEDGILWFKGTNNETGARGVWLDADKEVLRNREQEAGLRQQPKFKPNRRDTRRSTQSYKRW